MKSVTKLALLACLGLTVAAAPRPAVADPVSARLDALERENAALRARLNRLETSTAVKPQPRPADAGPVAPLAALPRAPAADSMASAPRYAGEPRRVVPSFELSGSLSFLQPGAGNLEYGTLTNPLPVVTPHWNNQSLKPNFAPSFTLGARYMPNKSTDIQLNWTHLNNTAKDSFFASPTEMVGPPYLIGPESALYKNGSGSVKTRFDAVNLDVGHTFCVECSFQMRAFGGVTAARIGQTLSGLFESPNGAASSGYTNNSMFTGAGPRLGIKGQYGIGDFQFIGEVAAAALVGTAPGPRRLHDAVAGVRALQPVSGITQRDAGGSQHRRPAGHRLCLCAQCLWPVQGRGRLQGGGLFRCGQFLCGDPGADQPHASAGRDLPRNAAASPEQLHQPRPLCDGQLGILVRRGFPGREGAEGSLAFVPDRAYIWDVARRWR